MKKQKQFQVTFTKIKRQQQQRLETKIESKRDEGGEREREQAGRRIVIVEMSCSSRQNSFRQCKKEHHDGEEDNNCPNGQDNNQGNIRASCFLFSPRFEQGRPSFDAHRISNLELGASLLPPALNLLLALLADKLEERNLI